MFIRSAAVVLVALLPVAQGCDSGLQQRLNTARDARFDRAAAAVAKVELDRNKALDDSLPKPDAKVEGDVHPMMAWRKAVTLRPDAQALNELAENARPVPGRDVGAQGTPAEDAAKTGAAFLKDVNDFWTGVTTLSRYMGALSNFDGEVAKSKARSEEQAKTAKGWKFVEPPFGDEARFDRWFVHAASYLNLSSLSDRSIAWDAMHPAYGIAFGISRRMGEGSSDYISRLCLLHESLKDKCKGVPHEYRAALADRAFQEFLLKQARDYRAGERGAVFAKVAKQFGDAMEAAVKTELSFKEDLVLPSTVAAIGGRSGVRFVLSPTTGITATTDADVKLAEKYEGTLPATFAADVAKLLADLKDKPGNRVDYQRIVLEMPGVTPIAQFLATVRAFPAKLGEGSGVKDIFLVGRRRVDESMRLAALKLRIPQADDSQTMTYQFKEDAAKSTCQLVGRVGDPPAGKKNEFDLEILPGKIRATPTTIDEATAARIPGDTVDLGTPADLGPLKAWLEANPGRVRAFVGIKGDYDKLMMLLSDLLFKCTDEEVAWDDTSKPKVTRTCGVSEARSTSFILALCE